MGHGSTTRTQTSRAGLTKGRPHTHTRYTSFAVRRVCSAGAQWFCPSPVAHRLASASPDRCLPNSPHPPFPPSSFIVRVEELLRSRCIHIEAALVEPRGLWSQAVAIDSAPRTSTRALVVADVFVLARAGGVVPLASCEGGMDKGARRVNRHAVLAPAAIGLVIGLVPVGIR